MHVRLDERANDAILLVFDKLTNVESLHEMAFIEYFRWRRPPLAVSCCDLKLQLGTVLSGLYPTKE